MNEQICIPRKRRWSKNYDTHHNYVAIYDTQHKSYIPDGMKFQNFSSEDIMAMKTKEDKSTYVHSICTHCGNIIKR